MGQFAGPVSQAAGAVLSAFGTVQGAYYNAAVMRNNARIAQYNAQTKLVEGQRAEEIQRLKTGQIIGSQKAAYAGGNIDVASGSAADVYANTAMLGELDALTLRYNAESEAAALRYEARSLNSQANQAITAGWISATATLLSGGSGVADKWATYKDSGDDNALGGVGESLGSALAAGMG